MNALDVVIILMVILFIVVGMYRGFIGSLAKLLGGVLKLVVAILLAKPFVKVLSLTKIDEHLFENLTEKFSGISDKFSVNLVGLDATELNVFIEDALTDAKIPKLFRGLFVNIFNLAPETIAVKESVTLAEMMGVTVTNIILLTASFVVLILLLWLVAKLIGRWSRRISRGDTLFAKTNKWLGAIFGLLKSLLVIFVTFVIVSLISDFGFMQSVIAYINNSFFGKWFYKLSQALINSSFDLQAMLESWLTKA